MPLWWIALVVVAGCQCGGVLRDDARHSWSSQRRGQLVWTPSRSDESIVFDFAVSQSGGGMEASRPAVLLHVWKEVVPWMTVYVGPEDWAIQANEGRGDACGSGRPPARLGWAQLALVLVGVDSGIRPGEWSWRSDDDEAEVGRLVHSGTGEAFDIWLETDETGVGGIR